MSTALTRFNLGVDHWEQIPATPEDYQRLLDERGEKSRPKYTFVDGRLTIVSPGHSHESIKRRLANFIEDILMILDVDYHPAGSVTLFTGPGTRTGVEADETYYLTNLDRVVDVENLVMGVDPAPDLVVEVVVTHPEGDALKAYAIFGVREVWVVKNSGLVFLTLNAAGRYEPTSTSVVLPFLLGSDELTPWLFLQGSASAVPLRRRFQTWVTETLVPRRRVVQED